MHFTVLRLRHDHWIYAAGLGLAALASSACAGEISPLQIGDGATVFTVGGSAYATAAAAFQPSARDLDADSVSAAALLTTRLVEQLGDGERVSVSGYFYLYHDRYSADNYDSDLVQKLYGTWVSSYGRLQIGMADGAAYALGLTGPVVDSEVSPESHNATFFPDPANHHVMVDHYAFNSTVETSFNYAKIVYYTPDWQGFHLGLSYAPSEGKWVIPFVDYGSRHSGRQSNIWEVGGAYQTMIGPVQANFSGGAGFSHVDKAEKEPGQAGLTDWALGAEFALPLGLQDTLGFGGAYHVSNAFGFCITDVRKNGQTDSAHASIKYDHGPWSLDAEYSDGTAKGGNPMQDIGVRAYASSLGYRVNSNWMLSLGWQEMRYKANEDFYNGSPRIHMDAIFLHLHFDVVQPVLSPP